MPKIDPSEAPTPPVGNRGIFSSPQPDYPPELPDEPRTNPGDVATKGYTKKKVRRAVIGGVSVTVLLQIGSWALGAYEEHLDRESQREHERRLEALEARDGGP